MDAFAPTARLSYPESNNQKKNEHLTKFCLSTNELSLSSRSSCTPLKEEFLAAEETAYLY